jgi:hypothetical protein
MYPLRADRGINQYHLYSCVKMYLALLQVHASNPSECILIARSLSPTGVFRMPVVLWFPTVYRIPLIFEWHTRYTEVYVGFLGAQAAFKVLGPSAPGN